MTYDVAILGSGLGGSMLACILAKHGLSVLVLEDMVHPRFTIGESLVPETGLRLRIVAEKYGVPEIGWLGSFTALRDRVSSNCGVKRSFSFLYHQEGRSCVPEHVNQLPTLAPPFGPDSHLFRQDTDAWLAAMSIHYGATLRQQTRIEGITFGAELVTLTSRDGESFKARFLIDGGGMRSLPGTLLGLRHEIPRFRTDSRGLYTHMVGVKPADFLVEGHGMPSPLGQATMHHVFDGGWIWVIPFDNHRDATNPLTSVGMMLDRRRYPERQGAPEDEFRAIIRRYPSIARHFAEARSVRPWVASGRLQYSSRRMTGPRMIQLPHAGAFIDPLYSSGMNVLTLAVDLIADALLTAFRDDDLAEERFTPITDIVDASFDHFDTIVANSFDSFASYETWNAWNRHWVMGNFMGTFNLMSVLVRHLATGDRAVLDEALAPDRLGALGSHLPQVRALMAASAGDLAAFRAGRASAQEAAASMFARLGSADFLPPVMGFGEAERRFPCTFTLAQGARRVLWYRHQGPKAVAPYCDFPLTTYAALIGDYALDAISANGRRTWASLRDIFFAGNDEWQHRPAALVGRGPVTAPAEVADTAAAAK